MGNYWLIAHFKQLFSKDLKDNSTNYNKKTNYDKFRTEYLSENNTEDRQKIYLMFSFLNVVTYEGGRQGKRI